MEWIHLDPQELNKISFLYVAQIEFCYLYEIGKYYKISNHDKTSLQFIYFKICM
jgi:hypothetical protein